MHACTLPVTQRMQIVFLLDNEIFRPLRFSVHSLQLLYFPASIAELAGESKSKIKPGKVYYYASIHDSQTFLRLLSPKKCWPSWTDPLPSPYAATLTKIAASRSPLKITCIKDECLTLLKIISSFRQRHITQHRVAVPVRIIKASCANCIAFVRICHVKHATMGMFGSKD